jgi:hypothetical protein
LEYHGNVVCFEEIRNFATIGLKRYYCHQAPKIAKTVYLWQAVSKRPNLTDLALKSLMTTLVQL